MLCCVNHCIFVLFSFGHCTLCPSIYGFWLSLCNLLQKFLPKYKYTLVKSLKTLYVIIYLTHMIRIRTWSLRNWFLLGSLFDFFSVWLYIVAIIFFYSTVFCWREWTIEAIYLFYSLRSNECSIRSRNFIPLANTWAPAGCVMGSMLLIFLLLCVVICVCVCVVFLLRLSLFCVLCAQYCQCIWVVHSWFYDSYNINHYYFLILCVVNSKVHSFQWRSLTLWTHITYIYLILCIRPWKLEKVLRYCSLHFIQLIEYLVYLDHF